MQIFLLTLIFFCAVWLVCVSVYFLLAIIRIADKLEVELPFMEKRRLKKVDEIEKKIRDEKFDQMLKELSCEKTKQREAKAQAETGFVYNELDELSDIDRSETDPDSLMELLEFGIPDEELNQILGSLEASSASNIL